MANSGDSDSNSNDDYLMARGLMPSVRLNYQAYLWREVIGFSLHPELKSKLKPNSRVADVATGTGIWLCEVANSISDIPVTPETAVRFDGFDISSDGFLNQHYLPANVKLHIQDFNREVPDEFVAQFDIVHVRLLLAVVRDNDPRPVLEHAKKLLKPGGYIQWDEMDTAAFQIMSFPGETTPCLQALANIWRYTVPNDWIADLGNIVQKNGFELIDTSSHNERPYQRQLLTSLWCLIAEEHAAFLEQSDVTKDKADAIKQLSTGAYKEMVKGAVVGHSIRVMIAKVAAVS